MLGGFDCCHERLNLSEASDLASLSAARRRLTLELAVRPGPVGGRCSLAGHDLKELLRELRGVHAVEGLASNTAAGDDRACATSRRGNLGTGIGTRLVDVQSIHGVSE